MRRILVPIDFSQVSKNALLYGLDMYKGTDTVFDILHVYHPSFDPSQTEIIDASSGIVIVKKENMAKLISSLKTKTSLEINGKVELGFAVEKITELSKDYDLIIMGATGTNSFLDKIFGGVSSDVAAKAKCPVLLVPSKIEYSSIQNIIYSCDFEGVNEKVLNEIISFSRRYNSALHFVHIKENEGAFKLELPKDLGVLYTINEIEANSVIDGINHFIEEKKADIVIMATKKRRFWEKIIHKSHTREMALNAKVPLLVYHENDAK